jgi:hypothetical protein
MVGVDIHLGMGSLVAFLALPAWRIICSFILPSLYPLVVQKTWFQQHCLLKQWLFVCRSQLC